MPRFFFDLTDGSRDPDELGTVLADADAAAIEAIRYLGEVLKQEPHRAREDTLRIDVRDAASAIRLTVMVQVSEGPADAERG